MTKSTRGYVKLAVLATFATAVAGGPALHAQAPAQGSAVLNPERAAALQALNRGDLVRISNGGVRDTGRVAISSPTEFAFRRRSGVFPVPASSIDTLWKWNSNAGTGALIGAIAVGSLGVFVGSIPFGGIDYEPSASQRLGPALLVGTLGATVGALFGGVIGSVLSHWELVHPGQSRAP